MTGAAEATGARLVAELEARVPHPLTFIAVSTTNAATPDPPAFLPRGLALTLDDGLGIVGCHAFGPPSERLDHDAADLTALARTPPRDDGERVLFLRNRFLLPRLARQHPALLTTCRAVLVQSAEAGDGRLDRVALTDLLTPFGLVQTGHGTDHLLLERPPDPPVAPAAAPVVVESRVSFEDGYLVGDVRLDRPVGSDRHVVLYADEVPVGIAPAVAGIAPDRVTFRIWAAPELMDAASATLSVALTSMVERVAVRRVVRPAARRFVPETLMAPDGPPSPGRRPMGVLVLASPADPRLPDRLDRLARQGAQGFTHLRLDGPDGADTARATAMAAALGFTDIVAHRGPVGRDKSAVQGLWHIARSFNRVLVPDGDGGSLAKLADALDAAPHGIVRDAGGWAAEGGRLASLARGLAWLFSLEEEDYRRWTAEGGDPLAAAFDWSDALSRLVERAPDGVLR